MPIGVIGGSGLYEIEGLVIEKEISMTTPFGEPSSSYKIGALGQEMIAFLPRQGVPHHIQPHKINYRANIWGFKSLGVQRIISVGAVGGMRRDMAPGSIVLLDQLIDMTSGCRKSTFYDEDRVVHIDFTEPYCPEMRDCIIEAAQSVGIPLVSAATYICVNGPRLETAKEITFFSTFLRGDVVGMTAMPEAVLARELELCLAGISVVTNYAAGIAEHKLKAGEVVETMKGALESIKLLVREAVLRIPSSRGCPCKTALEDAQV
ncbi:MAG: S-methyl-5'-thioadenosine phosphorylase [Dissulfurispiraceae bacterium]